MRHASAFAPWMAAGSVALFGADQALGGHVTETLLGQNGFTDALAQTRHGVGEFLGGVWDRAVVPAGQGLSAAVQHPAGNPWFQGLAALGMFILSWKGFSMAAAAQDGAGRKFAVGATGLVAIPALALAAAAFVGTFEDQPQNRPQSTISATQDQRLNPPGGQQLRPGTLTFTPGGLGN